jgi:hypothetical protein
MKNSASPTQWYVLASIAILSIACGFLLTLLIREQRIAESKSTEILARYATMLYFPATIIAADPAQGGVTVSANYERMGALQNIRFRVTEDTVIQRQRNIQSEGAYVGAEEPWPAAFEDLKTGTAAYILLRTGSDGRYEALQITLNAIFPPAVRK